MCITANLAANVSVGSERPFSDVRVTSVHPPISDIILKRRECRMGQKRTLRDDLRRFASRQLRSSRPIPVSRKQTPCRRDALGITGGSRRSPDARQRATISSSSTGYSFYSGRPAFRIAAGQLFTISGAANALMKAINGSIRKVGSSSSSRREIGFVASMRPAIPRAAACKA